MSSSGADGLGEYGAGSRSGGGEGDSNSMRAMVDSIAQMNGTATRVTASVRASILARVYSLFGARSAEDRRGVDMVLVYYFAVHGTSPDTEWASYGREYPMVANGRSVDPNAVIAEIGLNRLKKFMGEFSSLAIDMVHSSSEFAKAMAERASRANLAAGQEHLAIDYVGKDGSLSRAENAMRVATRDTLLHYRAANANNVSAERNKQSVQPTSDARGLSGSRPMLSFTD